MNTNSWEILLGISKPNIINDNSINVKTHVIQDDDDYITTKNLYLYSESFLNDIKEAIKDTSLKPDQIYDIFLAEGKIPVTRYGRLMAAKTFRDYVLDVRQEVGQESRPYAKCAKAIRLYDSGITDHMEISKLLNMQLNYVREVINKHTGVRRKSRNAEIKSKANEMVVLYVRDKLSTPKIAKLLNISTSAVKRNLVKQGVKLGSRKDYSNSKKVA